MRNSILKKIRLYQRHILDWVVSHNPNLGLDKRAEKFVELFERYLKPKSRVLDIGGSWGFYAKPIETRGHQHVVLDVAKPGLQHSPVVVYSGDEPMPFPDQSFDTSILITVLHHVYDPAAMMEEVKRVTSDTLIVVEDIYHHPIGRWWTKTRDQFYNFEFFGHPGNFKKKTEWIEWFENQGFKLIEAKPIYTWLSGLRILNCVFVFKVPPYQSKTKESEREYETAVGC